MMHAHGAQQPFFVQETVLLVPPHPTLPVITTSFAPRHHHMQVESPHTDVIHTVRACQHNDVTFVVVTTEAGVQAGPMICNL